MPHSLPIYLIYKRGKFLYRTYNCVRHETRCTGFQLNSHSTEIYLTYIEQFWFVYS